MTQRKKNSTTRSTGASKKKATRSTSKPAAQSAPKAAAEVQPTPKAKAAPAAKPTAAKSATEPVRKAEPKPKPLAQVDADERRRMVEEAAYYISLGRDGAGTNPNRDWSEAEAQIDALLAQEGRV